MKGLVRTFRLLDHMQRWPQIQKRKRGGRQGPNRCFQRNRESSNQCTRKGPRRSINNVPSQDHLMSQLHTPFFQRTQPSWWRPKSIATALCNSSKQALCKPMSALERGRKSIPRTTSMLVPANKKPPQRIDPFSNYLKRETC